MMWIFTVVLALLSIAGVKFTLKNNEQLLCILCCNTKKNNMCIQWILKQTAKYNCTVDF